MVFEIEPIRFEHKFPLETVVDGFYRKYPHPSRPEVVAVRTVSHEVCPNTQREERTRHIVIENVLPWVFRPFVSDPHFIFEEHSVYDPARRELTIRSRNVSFSSIISAHERSAFRVHPAHDKWTVFEQHGAIEASHYFGPLRSTLESFVAPQMREAGVSACKFLDSMLSNMAPE